MLITKDRTFQVEGENEQKFTGFRERKITGISIINLLSMISSPMAKSTSVIINFHRA